MGRGYRPVRRRPGPARAGRLRLHFSTHRRSGFDLFEYRFRPPQSFLNIGTNVFAPHDLFEFCLVNQLRRLLTRAAQDQRAFSSVELLGDLFEREQARGVDGGHIAQANDDDRGKLMHFPRDGRNLVGGTE